VGDSRAGRGAALLAAPNPAQTRPAHRPEAGDQPQAKRAAAKEQSVEDNQSTTQNLLKMYSKQDAVTRFNYWLLYRLSGFGTAPRDARVLDCGCAIGVFISFLKQKGFTNVQGFDASPEMVEASRAITRCEIKLADILDLRANYHAESFDIVSVSNLMHHVTDVDKWRRILAGIHDVLAPGGLLVMREPKRTVIYRTLEWMSLRPAFFRGVLKYRLQSIIEERGYLDYFFGNWYGAYREFLSGSGFTVEAERTSLGEQVLTCRRR
jgi:2-polyprenyl-3-methyl-5-hydroxy-6-metoxy-1,4-benzoquinol methylase